MTTLKKIVVDLGQPSTSIAKLNIRAKKLVCKDKGTELYFTLNNII